MLCCLPPYSEGLGFCACSLFFCIGEFNYRESSGIKEEKKTCSESIAFGARKQATTIAPSTLHQGITNEDIGAPSAMKPIFEFIVEEHQ
jgi:hypothetical protein